MVLVIVLMSGVNVMEDRTAEMDPMNRDVQVSVIIVLLCLWQELLDHLSPEEEEVYVTNWLFLVPAYSLLSFDVHYVLHYHNGDRR